jgi:hypothetical protein
MELSLPCPAPDLKLKSIAVRSRCIAQHSPLLKLGRVAVPVRQTERPLRGKGDITRPPEMKEAANRGGLTAADDQHPGQRCSVFND